MRDYVNNLRQRFGGAANLANFIGVSPHLVQSWCMGRREPHGAALRLLEVLGRILIEAPWLFETFTSKPAAARRPFVMTSSHSLPELPPVPKPDKRAVIADDEPLSEMEDLRSEAAARLKRMLENERN